MEETRPLPGGAGRLRAQPMTRADSPGHLIGAWRASLLQMCAFLPGQRLHPIPGGYSVWVDVQGSLTVGRCVRPRILQEWLLQEQQEVGASRAWALFSPKVM